MKDKNKPRAKILVVDDEENIRKSLRMILEYENYIFLEAVDGEDALDILDETVGVETVLLDVMLPGKDGLEILREIKKRPYSPEVIMISGHGTIQTAVDATKLGAFDFLEKPLHRERVLLSIRNALSQKELRQECLSLRKRAEKKYELIGKHPLMKKLWEDILKTAPTNATVLISGESGTGKELIARAIHSRSLRAREKFVQVNCAAIPEELIESELFGHEKGAFTGAIQRRTGRFEYADKATIFLDEIGDLPLETQAMLLRVLQNGEFERVGSSKTIQVDVRVIAATNRDLKQLVDEKKFRQDLFYRLNVFPVEIAPLRERKEDIPLLVAYFLEIYGRKTGKKIDRVSDETMKLFMDYSWPGNVRELENVIEHSLIISEGKTLTVPESYFVHFRPGIKKTGLVSLSEFEKQYILEVLQHTGGILYGPKGAARILGMKPSTLQSRMKKLGIEKSRPS